MRPGSSLLALGSAVFGIALLAILMWTSRIDLHAVLAQLENVHGAAFAELVLLLGLQTFLSAQKWRLMDAVVRHRDEPPLPISATFAMTSIGNALGQVLPLSISMVVARTLGVYGRNKAIARGTVGTVFDQAFDFLIVCLLIPASGATRFFRGGAMMWFSIAVPIAATAFLAVNLGVRLLDRLAAALAVNKALPRSRLRKTLLDLQVSGVLNATLWRKLLTLSCLRFAVLVLMAGRTTEAIGASVPLWHLAATMPFVVISTVIAVTPGGLGVNELTFAAVLSSFGTPLHAAAQWAVANRLLVAASSFLIAICAVAIQSGVKRLSSHEILGRWSQS